MIKKKNFQDWKWPCLSSDVLPLETRSVAHQLEAFKLHCSYAPGNENVSPEIPLHPKPLQAELHGLFLKIISLFLQRVVGFRVGRRPSCGRNGLGLFSQKTDQKTLCLEIIEHVV